MSEGLGAVVMGRVGVDLYPAPDQLRRPLAEIERFERFVGGFAATFGYGLLGNLPLERTAQLASAAGALITMEIPCSAAMPTLEYLEAFAEGGVAG